MEELKKTSRGGAEDAEKEKIVFFLCELRASA
jgi:hypothetical protein